MPYGVDDYKIQLGLPQLPPDETPKQLYRLFMYVFQAIQNLHRGVSSYCGIDAPDTDVIDQLTYQDTLLSGNLTRMYPIAGVAIARGQVVNLYDNAGALNARLAVATGASTMAHGVANAAAAPGQRVEINWLRGTLDSIGGMTLGSLYYLSTTPGAVQSTRPVGAGEIVQPIGFALASATMALDISLMYEQL